MYYNLSWREKISYLILDFDSSKFARQVKYSCLRNFIEIWKNSWLVKKCKNTDTKIKASEDDFCTKMNTFIKYWNQLMVHRLAYSYPLGMVYPNLLLERNLSEVQAKVEIELGSWLRKLLSLNSRLEVCTVYIFILILYWLSVLLPVDRRLALERSFPLLWKDGKPIVHWLVCCHIEAWECQTWQVTGLLKSWYSLIDCWRKIWYEDVRLELLFQIWNSINRLRVDVGQGKKHRISGSVERHLVNFLGPVTFHSLESTITGFSGECRFGPAQEAA